MTIFPTIIPISARLMQKPAVIPLLSMISINSGHAVDHDVCFVPAAMCSNGLRIGCEPYKRLAVTSLLSRLRPSRRGGVVARFPVLLAFIAVFGMLALTSWHEALPHMHDSEHVFEADRDHHTSAPDTMPDNANPMHQAAHDAQQSSGPAASPLLAVALESIATAWVMMPDALNPSLLPHSILRPPQG